MLDDNLQLVVTPEKLFRSRIPLGHAIDRMVPDGSMFVDVFGDVPDYICSVSAPLRVINDRSGRTRRLASRIDDVISVPPVNGKCACKRLKLSEQAKCPDGLYGTDESVTSDLMSARVATAARIGRSAMKSMSVDMSVKFVIETADILDVDPLYVHKLVPRRNVLLWYDPTIWAFDPGAKPGSFINRLIRLKAPSLVRCTGNPVLQTMLVESGWWLVIVESRFECMYCGDQSSILEVVACNKAYRGVRS